MRVFHSGARRMGHVSGFAARAGLLVLAIASATTTARAASDLQWTFNNVGTSDYQLTSASSTLVYGDGLPAADPTINLILGRRYGVTVVNFGEHPLQILAKGAGAAQDTVLLSMGATAGSLEGDAQIGWTDNGAGLVEFTVTATLIDAMNAAGQAPGYRCGVHTTTMRGDFDVFGTGQPIADPITTPIAKGDVVIEFETVLDGLTAPLGMTTLGLLRNDTLVYDQTGVVLFLPDGGATPTVFMDVSARLVALDPVADERGLLCVAAHPSYFPILKPFIYTYTSEPTSGTADFTTPLPDGANFNHQSVIAEWATDAADSTVIDPSTRREILRIDQPQGNHNGGQLAFGPDGMLYISLGDGGAGEDQGPGHGEDGNGQDANNVYGSILRIDVDGRTSANGQYGVPPDNPFVGADGLDEIYAYGFRNPFRFSFDAAGVMRVGDVGQANIEEIDIVTSGGNHGWRLKEGSFFFDPNGAGAGFVTDVPVLPPPGPLVDPVAEYDHDDGRAVIGGYVSRGRSVKGLFGNYVTGDYGTDFATPSGRLFYLGKAGDLEELRIGNTDRPFGLYLRGFGQDRSGDVYVFASGSAGPTGNQGVMLKIVAPPTLPTPQELIAYLLRGTRFDEGMDVNGDGLVDVADLVLLNALSP